MQSFHCNKKAGIEINTCLSLTFLHFGYEPIRNNENKYIVFLIDYLTSYDINNVA